MPYFRNNNSKMQMRKHQMLKTHKVRHYNSHNKNKNVDMISINVGKCKSSTTSKNSSISINVDDTNFNMPFVSPTLSSISNTSFTCDSMSPIRTEETLDEKIEKIKNELIPQVDHAHEEKDCESLQWRKPSILRLNRIFRKKISCLRPQFCFRSRIRYNGPPIFLHKSLRTVLTRMKLMPHDKLCMTCFDDHWKRMQCKQFSIKKERKTVIPKYCANNNEHNIFNKSTLSDMSIFHDKDHHTDNYPNCNNLAILFNNTKQSTNTLRHLGSTYVGSCRRSRRLIQKHF